MQDFDTWSGQERRIFRLLTRPRSTCGGYCRVGKTEASERTRLATAVCLWKELSQPCSQSAQMQKMMQDQEAALDMLRTTSLGAISACAGAGKTTVLVNLIRGLGPEALVWLCPATKEEKAAFVESLLDGHNHSFKQRLGERLGGDFRAELRQLGGKKGLKMRRVLG